MRRLFLLVLLLSGALTLSAQMVVPVNAANIILIPSAGSVQGANGTFFRSDVTLLNYRSSTQRVQLQWLPLGQPGPAAPLFVDINALSGINSEDFASLIMHQTGQGAILITGVTQAGAVDSAAQLVATSRIWTPEPGTNGGTNGQQFNGVPVASINSSTLSLIGHRRDARYRTNVGIVNLDKSTQSFRIDSRGSDSTDSQTVDVPAQSLVQVALQGQPSTLPLQILVTNVTLPPRTNAFLAYASSVDNITGDAWSSLGFNPPASAP